MYPVVFILNRLRQIIKGDEHCRKIYEVSNKGKKKEKKREVFEL